MHEKFRTLSLNFFSALTDSMASLNKRFCDYPLIVITFFFFIVYELNLLCFLLLVPNGYLSTSRPIDIIDSFFKDPSLLGKILHSDIVDIGLKIFKLDIFPSLFVIHLLRVSRKMLFLR